MENVRGDMLVIARDKLAGVFIEHDEAGRVGRADAFVRVVHAGAGIQVKIISMDEN